MKIINRKSVSLGNDRTRMRNKNSVRRIILHHCATQATRNTKSHEGWWINPIAGMGGVNAVGGYHELIHLSADGNVIIEINYDATQIAHGAGWEANSDGYHICVAGDYRNGSLTKKLKQALLERIRLNMNMFAIPVELIIGHNEVYGQNTSCPGFNVESIRNELRLPTVANSLKKHTVRAGDTLTGIARDHETTVSEIQRLNNIQNIDLIRIGQILVLSEAQLSIQIGSRVRVNTTARNWATGQLIPIWVLGREYNVKQIRRDNTEILLTDVVSWIRIEDVKFI